MTGGAPRFSRRLALATTLLACVGLLAGSATPPKKNRYARKGARKAYLQLQTANERELILYFGVSTALIMRANLLSAPFRAAMTDEFVRQVGPDEERLAEWTATMERHHARHYEVVFSADSGIDDAEFGRDLEGWVLRLEADGVEQPVVAIERVPEPTPVQQALFPHYNIWSDLWIARFEKTVPNPEAVVLHVGSGYGNGEMSWVQPENLGGIGNEDD